MDHLLETCFYVRHPLYYLKAGKEEEQTIFQSRRQDFHHQHLCISQLIYLTYLEFLYQVFNLLF